MAENKKREQKPKRRLSFTGLGIRTFGQTVFLTTNFYFSNNLVSHASACAFGFLFSFIPVVMMILTVLIRILHTSGDTIKALLQQVAIFSETLDLDRIIQSVISVKGISAFEIGLGFAIFWMARRFFASLVISLQAIFKTRIKQRPVISQVFVFVGEAVFVLATTITIAAVLFFKSIQHASFFENIIQRLPLLAKIDALNLATIVPLAAMFFIVAISYRAMSFSKPKWTLCLLSSGGLTAIFWAVLKIMKLFTNVSRYNMVYGVMSNIIVLLLEVFMFFSLYLFFAQLIFVVQFFDELLLGELYTLPGSNKKQLGAKLKRKLFMKPDYFLKKNDKVIKYSEGNYIYRNGDQDIDAFYVVNGTVEVIHKNIFTFVERGGFFGEEACLLNEQRNEDAIAATDVTLIRVPSEAFLSHLEKNQESNQKALSQISEYFAKIFDQDSTIEHNKQLNSKDNNLGEQIKKAFTKKL